MVKLNRPFADDQPARSFRYDLPDWLANTDKCFAQFEAKSYADCAHSMRNAYERLMTDVKARTVFLDKRLTAMTANQRQTEFEASEAAYDAFARGDIKAQQHFLRSLTLACHDNCLTSWSTNIYDNAGKSDLEPTRENFSDLVALAYPDSGISDAPDLVGLFEDLRRDLLDAAGHEQAAVSEVKKADEKN
jgi:hypothetical protein